MGGSIWLDLSIQIPKQWCDLQKQDPQFPWAPKTPTWCLIHDLFFLFLKWVNDEIILTESILNCSLIWVPIFKE